MSAWGMEGSSDGEMRVGMERGASNVQYSHKWCRGGGRGEGRKGKRTLNKRGLHWPKLLYFDMKTVYKLESISLGFLISDCFLCPP